MDVNLKLPPPVPRIRDTAQAQQYTEQLYGYLSRTVTELNRILTNLDDSNIISLSQRKIKSETEEGENGEQV